MVRKVIGGGLAEHDRADRAHARDFDRVTADGCGKQPRPLCARCGRRKAVHVVDRLREQGNAVERSTERPTLCSCVGVPSIVHRCLGQHVDRVQRSIPRVAPAERFLRYLNGAPITTRASGLILDDRAGQRIRQALRPSNERNGEQRAQFTKSFASSKGHD
jgi:hypothetical protein